MSDYLNSLAARSLNLTSMIEPRLASMFEPPSVATGLAAAEQPFEMENQIATTSQPEEPKRKWIAENASRIGDLVVPRLNLRALPDVPIAKPERSESVGRELQADTSGRFPPYSRTELVPDVSRSSLAPLKVEGDASGPPTRLPAGAQAPGAVTERAPIRVTTVSTSPQDRSGLDPGIPRIVGEQVMEQSRSREHARGESVPLERAQASASISATSSQAAPAVRPAAGVAALANPETRTIRVTIGRIDVRAIMPQPPQPLPAPPRPRPLSLEQYLKQREGDKR